MARSDLDTRSERRSEARAAARSAVWARAALDALYPPLCLLCSEPTAQAQALCLDCWSDTRFIGDARCDACGVGLSFAPPADAPAPLCPGCVRERPTWDRGRAAVAYEGGGRALVLALKHGDRTDAAAPMGRWMAHAGRDLFAAPGPPPLVAPAPLHWLRRARRRFNQASELARAVAAETGAPMALDLLRRVRATPSQGGRGLAARRKNVQGAFRVARRWRARWAGAAPPRIVLVDDVMTTGATLEACAAALRAAGAERVDALVFARVSRDWEDWA